MDSRRAAKADVRPPTNEGLGPVAALRILYGLMTGTRRRHLMITLALMLLGAAAEMMMIGAVLPFLALASDPGSPLVPTAVREWLGMFGDSPVVGAAIVLALAAIAAAAVRLGLAWATQSFVMKFGHELASGIFSRMLHQPYSAYLRRNSSEILSGIEKVQGVIGGVLQPVVQGIIAAVIAIFVTAFLFVINALAASIGASVVAFAYFIVSRFSRERVRANSRIIAQMMTLRTKTVQEGLGGIRDIILEQSQSLFEDKFRTVDWRHRRAIAANVFMATTPRFIIETAGIIAIALMTLVMSFQSGGVLEAIPVLGALGLGAQRLLPLVQQAWQGWSHANGNLQLLADVAELIRSASITRAPRAEAMPFSESIVFDHVSFRHEGAAFSLEDVSFRIGKGDRIGIAGQTGSGKSTLLDLLMGLLEPTQGEIRIDGRVIDEGNRKGWQAAIAHVPQSVYLADDTVAANIAFAAEGEPNMDRVRTAATAACLEEFLASLPDGFDTRVGERGIRLSGGQRQRIGIARALYRGASVLILDEATSALDDVTEDAVLSAIVAGRPDLTVVMVAHRGSSLARCDTVLRMSGGRIVPPDPVRLPQELE